MAQVILDGDVVVRVAMSGGVEVGPLPKNVGMERLRWNGQALVDLAELTEMWVKESGGGYSLHAVEVPGAQLVTMTWQQRKKLKTVDGQIQVVLLPPAEVKRAFQVAVQRMLDTEAQKHNFDTIVNACAWAGALPIADDLKAWGAACWIKAAEIEAELVAGTRQLPTVAQFLAEMPTF